MIKLSNNLLRVITSLTELKTTFFFVRGELHLCKRVCVCVCVCVYCNIWKERNWLTFGLCLQVGKF